MHQIEREWMDKQEAEYVAWERANADRLEEEAYAEWATMAREDGEDSSRDAYDDYIQSLIPDYA